MECGKISQGIDLRVSQRIIHELMNTGGLSATAKATYVATMVHRPSSIQTLAKKVGVDWKTAFRHCKKLEEAGWLKLDAANMARNPAAILPPGVEAMLAIETNTLLDMAHFKGEETTKAFEDWVIAPTVRLIYDSRPPFLVNPETEKRLEFDIFAPDYAWATEYMGDQHFSTTELYPDKNQLRERQKRDLMKVGLCNNNNIRLSVICKRDLTLGKILAAIPPDIPRRCFDPKGPFVQMLEKVGREVAGKLDYDRG